MGCLLGPCVGVIGGPAEPPGAFLGQGRLGSIRDEAPGSIRLGPIRAERWLCRDTQKSRWPSEDNYLRLFNGAAYRIRTYDLLIRSQTLYPAELMPQRS